MIIKQDLMDGIMYRGQRAQNEALVKLESTGEKKLKTWPPMVQDLYAGLFKQAPEFSDEAKSPLQTAVKDVMATKEWGDLREHTRLDEFGASVGTTAFGKAFLDGLPKEVIDAENALNDLANADAAVEEALELGDDNLIKAMQELANLRKQKVRTAMAAAEKACDGDISQAVRIAGRVAAKVSSDTTKEARDFASAWGDEKGMGGHVPLGEQLRLANKIKGNESLKLLARMVGRLKRLAQGYQAKKIDKTPEEIVDIECGNDLKRVIPSEFLYLSKPHTKILFKKKYVEGTLLLNKMIGNNRAGKGDLVLLTDESGSMGGTAITWAKGVGLALAWIAQKQKRNLILGGFSSGGQIWTKTYSNGKVTPKDVEEYAAHFYGGGTDFEMALSRGLAEIKKSKSMKKADLVFISDGDCWCSDEFLSEFKKQKNALGMRVISIGVGCSEESFKTFSDVAFGFKGSFKGEEAALERVFSV